MHGPDPSAACRLRVSQRSGSLLDLPLRLKLLDEIRVLPERFGVTVLYVTHNQAETFILGDHAAVIHEGRIEQSGPPREIYESPRTAFIASLLGRCALVPGRRIGGVVETAFGSLPAPTCSNQSESDVCIVVRSEDVHPSEDGPFIGSVDRARWLGGFVEAEVAGAGWRLWCQMRDEPKVGSRLRFNVAKLTVVPAVSDPEKEV